MSASKPTASAYAQAGVNLDASDETLAQMKDAVTATYTPQVLAGLGAFGGLFDAAWLKEIAHPVLVASADGVGTKTKVAAALDDYRTIGEDLVNHCVNDILVQGAKPLFFLDYVASARLEPKVTATLVSSVARGCQKHGIPLLGGETAEMPGVYQEREFDLVGTLVGVVDKAELVTGERVQAGDVILGLPSGGLQTNGFSLARHVLENHYPARLTSGQTVGDALLAPHKSFFAAAKPLLEAHLVRGMAHITGGGIPSNLPRILPEGLGALVSPTWAVPEIFEQIATLGNVSEDEMYHVFNMGVGFLFIVAPEDADLARAFCPELFMVGEIIHGSGVQIG